MADTNAGALCEAGRRDAQALTVTGRRCAHTGSIRRAVKALTRTAKAVTPETPNGTWLRDNRTLARAAADDAAAALRHAHTLRASGAQTVLHACCAGLLHACGNALTPKAAQAYLAGFQDVLPLETAELALLVPGLQAATVCALADTYAHDGAAAPALFTSLRALGTAAWGMLAERCDRVGRILARDPVGVYPAMDEATRAYYRQTVARLARRTGRAEIDIAEDVLARAQSSDGARRHVGWFLLREVLGAPEKCGDGAWYIAAVVVGTLFLSLLLGFATKSVSGAVLLLIPVSEVVKGLLDAVLLRVTKPRFVPRLALRRGIPPEGRTLCVIAALLTSPGDAHTLAARLEEYALCNRDAGEQLLFGLLADLPEADMEHAPIDPAILRAARTEIEALNARYGGRFYLFTRERVQTPDGKWSAWERKRGALLRLAQLLCGEADAMHCAAGDAAALRGTAYLLTLDADTRLTPGAARALVGAMLHPLNRPVVDARRGVVTHGYGLLHPRMATELQSARASDWARVFAGPGGSDPYGGVCGELYMDCFDRGGFSGKGILDVRALLACCGGDALPEQRILSHDALEGAYLHGGFLGDVELTDTFPAAPLAWGARAHRWIRGDWQNAPWIFSRRARALQPIDRFRLADSLRRSLVAPATWAAIFLGCVLRWPGLRLAAYAALLALAQGLIFALGHPIVHPADARVRYHSSVLPGLAAAVVQTVLRLILLPWEAVLNASAIVTALWRMLVSHKNLLQWQTAAQRAAQRDGLGAYLRALWPASALGLLTAVLTPSPTGLAAGIVWTLSPFVLAALGAPNADAPAQLSRAAQRELLGWAKATWRYFETFCTAGEHYLPPDNVQTQPPTGTAHRTSPTNMGFALLSALGAHALGVDNGRGLALAEQMLTTMEQLPRWNGHFYNWYHTCTLRPMPPLYVSTVDSGNCAAALLAAANALRGWGQDELAARAQALCDGMDFALLYDPQRRLMHIGIDTGSGKRSEGYYDLLESEARLTSYFAVARGDVPREHWRALSRAQVQHERYRGCVSWSGSVFEYLMPELFLPPQRDSLLWESAKFCLRVQRRRVRAGQPWGVSESAYFALDSALSYRYKAHGCAALAMQPDMDRELVLSPYSAFLALAVAPRAAVRDLRRFAARGLPGQYGFREALDCTRARTGGGGQIVHCVMAHHQGMSLLSACNALCGGQVQRWFLADPAMRAHMSLLSERLPLGAPALRRRPEAQRSKPRRRALPDYTVEGTGVDAESPRCTLLSNGTYCLAVTEAGQSFARWHALSVCRRGTRSDPAAAPVVSLETDGACTPLLPGTADAARWRFTVRAAQFSTRHGSVTAVQTFTVPERVNGEVRALTLSSPDGIDGTVRLTFEAVLAPLEDYVNHPAFARLGFQSVLRRNALLLRRLGRGGKPETWLCAVCDRQADFCAEGAIPGWLRAGYVQVRVAVHTPPDTPWRVRFALGVGAHEDDAFAAAQRALVLPPESAAALPGTLAAQYGMTDAELEGAMAHISPLLFPTAAPDAAAEQLKRPALWAHGISGDLPVWCARPEAHVLQQWALLRALGIGCDLALCSSDGGDYLQPTRAKVRGVLAALDLAHCLDAPGGVHLVPEDAFADVAAAAAIRPGMAHTRCTLPLLPPPGDRRTMPTGSEVCWDADGTVSFTGLPPRAWSNVLTNGRFGFLATDAGTGHLWYRNAHTGRINRWLCDPWVLRGTETLRMTTRTGAVSLFNDDGRARVEYGFGWAAWERTVDGMSVRVTAFVPEDANARVLLIECAGRARITWHTDLVCAGHDADAPAVITAYSGGVFTAENARADAPLHVCAAAGMPLTGWTCDRFSFLRGQMDRRAGAGLSPCFALEGIVERQGVLVCGCDTRANLLRLTQPDEAVRALHRVRERWLGAVSRLWITTPDESMNRYLGGWAAYQTLCCRLMARTSLYQNGGAFGFRDQLQDAVNLLLLDSKPAREQIGCACAHQFSAGDVCHWWHAGFGVEHGVRTRISDDLLWLPWAVCEYAQKTGDTQILSAEYPFLAGEELEENERDRYQPLTPGAETGTVLEHCRRAFMRVLARGVGAHGLLLIGTGDWNDAFDRVGAQGRGESVWLTWFFAVTARKFAALIGGHAAKQLTLAADRCTRAAEAAWDGAWYRRGYYDDGQPLGSEESGECRIDAIAQAFAAFDTHADPAHVHCALTSAVEQLFDREHNVVRLFDPPITRRTPETGYVRSYGAGLRENGGQYTHGALWLAMALLRTGRTDEGVQILRAVLPAAHDPARYEGEPYVLAADVAAGDNAGAAGWTWYTGAAGWYLRITAEELLGLHLRGGVLYPEPHLPAGWPECTVRWRDGAGLLHTIRLRPDGVTVDGEGYDGGGIGKKRPKPYSQDR